MISTIMRIGLGILLLPLLYGIFMTVPWYAKVLMVAVLIGLVLKSIGDSANRKAAAKSKAVTQ